MRAIDTSVVVRFILRDEPRQSEAAATCIAGGVFVSDGVMMETEWVLRSVGWSRPRVNRALESFLAIDQVAVAQPDYLMWALERHLAGADWADMLHLIAARGNEAFVTFDRKLAKRAGDDALLPVAVLR